MLKESIEIKLTDHFMSAVFGVVAVAAVGIALAAVAAPHAAVGVVGLFTLSACAAYHKSEDQYYQEHRFRPVSFLAAVFMAATLVTSFSGPSHASEIPTFETKTIHDGANGQEVGLIGGYKAPVIFS